MFQRIKRTRDGGFRVTMSAQERALLAPVPEMLRSLVRGADKDDLAYKRLFPPAFLDDEARDEAFAEMVHGDLSRQRLEAADAFETTLDSAVLTREEAEAWLAVLNDCRLILGSRLALTEDTDASDLPPLYRLMSALVTQLVAALGGPAERELTWTVLKRMAREGSGKDGEPRS